MKYYTPYKIQVVGDYAVITDPVTNASTPILIEDLEDNMDDLIKEAIAKIKQANGWMPWVRNEQSLTICNNVA